MLIKNNDTIIKLDGTGLDAKIIKDTIKELEKYAVNDNIVFVFTEKYKKTANVLIDPIVKMPAGEHGGKEYGEYLLRYYETEVLNNKNQKVYSPDRIAMSGRLVVNIKTNPTLAYFLYAGCPHCENGKATRMDVPAYFKLEQKVLEAKQRNEKRKYRNTVETMIMQPIENGGMDEADLRKFAKSIFIPAAASVDLDLLRDRVYSAVINGEMFDKFLDRTGFDERLESKELASDLVTYNVIKAFDDKGKKIWRFIEDEGKPGEKIVEIPNKSISMNILAEKLFKDYELRQEAKRRLEAVLQAV